MFQPDTDVEFIAFAQSDLHFLTRDLTLRSSRNALSAAPQLCTRGAADTSPSTPLRARSPTRVVLEMARRQPHLHQTPHPFLPTLIEALERHEHFQITQECRTQLLSMSAATADRLLSSQRKRGRRVTSTTRAGTLLRQKIPIRTFEERQHCVRSGAGFNEHRSTRSSTRAASESRMRPRIRA
jgi:hypothetical protein